MSSACLMIFLSGPRDELRPDNAVLLPAKISWLVAERAATSPTPFPPPITPAVTTEARTLAPVTAKICVNGFGPPVLDARAKPTAFHRTERRQGQMARSPLAVVALGGAAKSAAEITVSKLLDGGVVAQAVTSAVDRANAVRRAALKGEDDIDIYYQTRLNLG